MDADWVGETDCIACEDVMEAMARSPEYAALIPEFSLIRGYPQDPEGQASLAAAEKNIVELRRISGERARSKLTASELAELVSMEEKLGLREFALTYNRDNILQSSEWWYIPRGGIGCGGYIVNKKDCYVNWLGSGVGGLRQWFWGHNRGLYCDLIDFTFAPDTSLDLAGRLLRRFQSLAPDAQGRIPVEERWYHEFEIEPALRSQFPTFKNHFVWIAIPDIKAACENEGLRFTAVLGDKSEQYEN